MIFKSNLKVLLFLFIVLNLVSCKQETASDMIKNNVQKQTNAVEQLSYHERYLKEISELPTREASEKDTLQMVKINSQEFLMGGISTQARKDEFPRHEETVETFWIDKTEVTNKQFSEFTEATGYITTAERKIEIEGKTYEPGALVFNPENPTMWPLWTK